MSSCYVQAVKLKAMIVLQLLFVVLVNIAESHRVGSSIAGQRIQTLRRQSPRSCITDTDISPL